MPVEQRDTRSQRCVSRLSCVAITKAAPSAWQRSRIRSSTWSAVCESRLAVGSSAITSARPLDQRARDRDALALAARERVGPVPACSCSPTASSCAATRSRRSAAGTPAMNSG